MMINDVLNRDSGVDGLGVDRLQLNAASALTSVDVHLNFEVASIAPRGAPRVFHDVVGRAIRVDSVANGEDTVVEAAVAVGGHEDTRFVRLELGLVGLDGDGHGALIESSLELSGTLGSHGVES